MIVASPLPHVRDRIVHFEGSSSDTWVVVFLATVLLLVLIFCWYRWVGPRVSRGRARRHLFRRLIHAHGLVPPEVRFLKRMARRHRLPFPAMVFVKRSLFDEAVCGSGPDADRCAGLRERLFSTPSSEENR